MKTLRKILVARTDRLGDVLLTLPTLRYLRHEFPNAQIDFLCVFSVGEVLVPFFQSEGIRWKIMEDMPAIRWREEILRIGYEAALLLHAPLPLLSGAWRAGVTYRIGPYSKVFSYFFLNGGCRQYRSKALKNEAEYNLELARLLVKRATGKVRASVVSPIEIGPEEGAVEKANRVLEEKGILRGKDYVVVHPGMGGSAVNLSAKSYSVLIQQVQSLYRVPVVVTVGPVAQDQSMASELIALNPGVIFISEQKLTVIREIFRRALFVVAPSTGPLHLAHYVGSRTLGIYSPVRSHHKRRWAPWGGTGESHILSPGHSCPATTDCIGRQCQHFPCLDNLFQGNLISRSESALREVNRGNHGL